MTLQPLVLADNMGANFARKSSQEHSIEEQVKDKEETSKNENYVPTYENNENNESEDFGFFFYPKRNPGVVSENDPKDKISQMRQYWGRNPIMQSAYRHLRCQMNVVECASKNPRIQLLMRALKTHGCPVRLGRHVSCEPCKLSISGGFDFYTNQVVVCENNVTNQSACCNVLAHELLHAFDQCRAKFDIKNIEHLACTEVRAANMFHCSLGNALVSGEARPWDIKQRHRNCVKRKALTAVMLVRNVTSDEANEVIDKVFQRCYNDLEPFGRRLKVWGQDDLRALHDGILYGYIDP